MRSSMMLVRTTVATKADADRLAHRLVDDGLAACVHVEGISSTYIWQGRRVTEPEFEVEARTTFWGSERCRKAMLLGHPYDVPMVESETTEVNGAYEKWARSTMKAARRLAKARGA